MGQKKISEAILESILKWLKVKTQHSRICRMLLKQGLGKFIALHAYVRKEWSHVSDLCSHLKKLEKEQIKCNIRRGNEIIKIGADINEMWNNNNHNQNNRGKVNETKFYWFFKIKKIDKPLTRLIRKKGEKTQMTQMRKVITLQIPQILKRTINKYYKQMGIPWLSSG